MIFSIPNLGTIQYTTFSHLLVRANFLSGLLILLSDTLTSLYSQSFATWHAAQLLWRASPVSVRIFLPTSWTGRALDAQQRTGLSSSITAPSARKLPPWLTWECKKPPEIRTRRMPCCWWRTSPIWALCFRGWWFPEPLWSWRPTWRATTQVLFEVLRCELWCCGEFWVGFLCPSSDQD